MPGKVFVKYRRDDVRDMAARIRDRIAATLGDNLMAGQRFDRELERALSQTDVLFAHEVTQVVEPGSTVAFADRVIAQRHRGEVSCRTSFG